MGPLRQTVGYGDFSPTSGLGRLVTVLWIMPGGIALWHHDHCQSLLASKSPTNGGKKCAVYLVTRTWKIILLNPRLARFENPANGPTISGVTAVRSDRDIVLCSAEAIENPMPDQVRFVRDTALNTSELLRRAAVAAAGYIIALGHDDNETLAAALGASAVNHDAHLVAYFDQPSFARIYWQIALSPRGMQCLALDRDDGSIRPRHAWIALPRATATPLDPGRTNPIQFACARGCCGGELWRPLR